ncbi:siderophore-interacting protein [Rothia kristinae]|nr:siderophore-interacting protein [Rothia kristinae]MCT1357720.1 siderophore-interacting protein [Rothia kristinae]MCT1393391.1 siderophore-interacting protein [Rothia kristinae]MCT1505579.1 siderophore-interacting protein [Rothia kristinae]MCT2038317.1 siderophore-interacting protein [Rothia kristinae]MCT2243752.1 siderophore-interacting protein [Rothia kristinae]
MSVHPLVVRTVRVLSVQEVTPRMRRIRLGGEQLSSFVPAGLETTAPAFRAPSFDDHVKLIFAENGPVQAVLPRKLSEGIEWTPASARITRDYTPRAVDTDAGGADSGLRAARARSGGRLGPGSATRGRAELRRPEVLDAPSCGDLRDAAGRG